jgi:arsenite/tail-anchored protein-transporting ATPase
VSTRVLLFTGKGGVGKTTIAAATALRCAAEGKRTLVLSTDPAHSLADALAVPLEDRPTEVGDHLWGQQLDARRRLEEQWGELRGYITGLLKRGGVKAVEAEELTVLPGLDEILALTDLASLVESGEWDVVVVDCAPTAETIRLLSLPQTLSWWIERLFPFTRQAAQSFGPMLLQTFGVPVPDEKLFSSMETLYQRLAAVAALLGNGEQSSVRIVVNPDRVVVAEARRTFTYLSLFGFAVDAVVVNRMLPDAVHDPWFERWKVSQAEQLETVREGFAPLPVLTVELAEEEPVGVELLTGLANNLYRDIDPWVRMFDGELLTVDQDEDGTLTLRMEMPFAEKGDVQLARRGGELQLTVGPYRRALSLPEALARRKVTEAAVKDGHLVVVFT